jgi:hypothetical protein
VIKLAKKKRIILIAPVLAIPVLYICFRWFFSVPDNGLLATLPSGEPGWHGIVPGESSGEEARRLLKESLYVRRASISYKKTEYPNGTTLESIHWDNRPFNVIPLGFKKHNELVTIDGIVRRIEVGLEDTIRAEDLISHLGKPEGIGRRAETTIQGGYQTGIYLLYTRYGIAFRCVGMYSVMEGRLVPDAPATHVYYFEVPPLEDAVGTFPPIYYVNHPEETQEWSGYDPAP